MSKRNSVRLISVLLLCLMAFSPHPVTATAPDGTSPVLMVENTAADEPIIIDHTCTDLSKIPPYWIEQAKAMTFHIAHTSHGSQIISGIEKLEQVDSTYSYARLASGTVGLPSETNALLIYDGNNCGTTYITPELYWSTADGIANTQSVADTGWFDISTWTWCGQQSSNLEAQVQTYLSTLSGFEAQYQDMRFVLMTGHTDGGSATLAYNNNLVRQYALDNNMVLFDFADIEEYDPLGGGPYVNNGEGTCTWCESFCDTNPSYCTDLPDSCSHSSSPEEAKLFCKLKGNAFWWMMARLAGWPGPDAPVEPDLSASSLYAQPAVIAAGKTVTFTANIVPGEAAPAANVQLTTTLPTGLSYVNDSMAATSGNVNASGVPLLQWSQSSVSTPVTITYAAMVDGMSTTPYTLTNTALISATNVTQFSRETIVFVNGQQLFLPMILK